MKALASKLASTMKERPIQTGGESSDRVPASLLAGASFPVPEGWHADETTGLLLRDTIHSMLRRRSGWNYKGPGLYMITLTLADRSRGWLGELEILGSKLPSAYLFAGASLNQLASWIVEGTGEQARQHLARRHYRGAVVADVEKLAFAAVGA